MKRKNRRKTLRASGRRAAGQPAEEPSWDANHAYIAGCTEGGVPYGITWDQFRVAHREAEGMSRLRARDGQLVPAADIDFSRLMLGPRARSSNPKRASCFACGSPKQLIPTECCGSLVCVSPPGVGPYSNPVHDCKGSHARYTLCGYHFDAEHGGDWTSCEQCKAEFEPELYQFYASNRFNSVSVHVSLEVIQKPSCTDCGKTFSILADAFAVEKNEFLCSDCDTNRSVHIWMLYEEDDIDRSEGAALKQVGPQNRDDDDIPF